jgi:predicted nucleic acid-binding protein
VAHPVAVTNTTPIIALVGVGELRLLDALFERVVVPFEVWDELTDKPGAPEPEALRTLQSVVFLPAPAAPTETASLHAGEAAAIALALTTPGARVLLDDIAARRIADGLGLTVKGTLGLLVEAKRQGLLPSVRPLVERMIENGFRLAPSLVASVLSAAGER